VRRQQDGPARGGQLADRAPEVTAGFDVHADRRLVEEEEIGVAADGQREQHPLPLAAGQLAEAPVLHVLQPGEREDLRERQWRRIVGGEQVDVLADRERLRHLRHLQHHAHAAATGHRRRRAAEEARLAGARTGQAGEQAHRGRLAGAVRAEQRRDLPRLERQRDVGQRGDAAILVRDGDELGDGSDHAHLLREMHAWCGRHAGRGQCPASSRPGDKRQLSRPQRGGRLNRSPKPGIFFSIAFFASSMARLRMARRATSPTSTRTDSRSIGPVTVTGRVTRPPSCV
jgi:hypothetical protein